MMKRIAVITPMLQPYRVSFYEKLSLHDPVYEWNIFHGVSIKEDGRPNYTGETNFKNTGCREYILYIGPFKIVYNRGIYSGIRRFDPDLVILQGIAGNISTRMVTSWARWTKKKIIIWTSGWKPGLAKGKLPDSKYRDTQSDVNNMVEVSISGVRKLLDNWKASFLYNSGRS